MRQLDASKIEETLTAVGLGVLSMVDDDQPYAVPVPFGYADDDICFMFQADRAKKSRKLAAIAADPRVCLTVVQQEQEPTEAWRSVVVTGELVALPVDREADAFAALADNAAFAPGYTVFDAPARDIDLHVFRLEPTEITGREFRER